jgi:hypothetical protein
VGLKVLGPNKINKFYFDNSFKLPIIHDITNNTNVYPKEEKQKTNKP